MRAGMLALFLVLGLALPGRAQLVVHEWGTFTALEDETGRAIGGINTDDEPVPDFVHRAVKLIQSDDQTGKGIPANDSEVTMRLETPVIYFHLPAGEKRAKVDVSVSFHGGWVTEFFPSAETIEPGLSAGGVVGHLSEGTTSTLTWRGVRVGESGEMPATEDPVWTSPREVRCDPVRVGDEGEKFLFYRGVGHVELPVRVGMDSEGKFLVVDGEEDALALRRFWLVDVRQDGKVAWKVLGGPVTDLDFMVANQKPLAMGTAQFEARDYGDGEELGASLRDALVRQGLFRDEAEALLKTWEQSYFKSPGLRLFFLVNPAWTNRVLPLKVSGGAAVTRVMVGRIELVTPGERELIGQIMAGGFDGNLQPNSCAAYEELGRFRNALLLDELARNPNAGVENWLVRWGVRAFVPG